MTIDAILAATSHRPWPIPPGPWSMRQRWHDLLFAHWPMPPPELRERVPGPLELDTYDGQAWVGVIPFRMSGVRFRGWPAVPGTSAFLELNVRTYVRYAGRPGVFFFSLDAGSALAVGVARRWFHLPYYRARMRLREFGHWVHYDSLRTHSSASPGEFLGRYRPFGDEFRAVPGSLEHFLTERYCLYTFDPRGRLMRGEIQHAPWSLQPARADFDINTMAAASGITLPEIPPVLQFARRLEVLIWPLETC